MADHQAFRRQDSENLSVTLHPGAQPVLAGVAAGQFSSVGAYRLQLLAERLELVSGFDELICLERLDFSPFPYQVKAARAALRRFRGRGLLCDEAGRRQIMARQVPLKLIQSY